MNVDDEEYLQRAFADLLNYEADDVSEPINPLRYKTPEGDTCLHIAASRGDARSVQLLLNAGLAPNEPGDMGNTPLHYANKGRHVQIESLLIAAGASPSQLNEFGTAAKG
jgi:ankyrin repeat protein